MRLCWSFLQTVMQELGFPERFVSGIMNCVTSVSYSILVNGVPSVPFKAQKGLRQANVSIPFCHWNGLSRCLADLALNPNFN